MCGIFGLIRSSNAIDDTRASAALIELGHLAVSRGRDSAGLAFANPVAPSATTSPNKRDRNAKHTVINGTTIVRDLGSFDRMWNDHEHAATLAGAKIVVGHTRWATQGDRTSMLNVSPMAVGPLVGTHNGDITPRTVKRARFTPAIGGTDTEELYLALAETRQDRRRMVDVLSKVEGRAALAWMDRSKADRVYLARTALAPLSIAFDAQDNLYWASNPDWFRQVDAKFGGAIGFHSIRLVAEGTLLTINAVTVPEIEDQRTFEPVCRAKDEDLASLVVWRGFTKADEAADRAQLRHRVAQTWTNPRLPVAASTDVLPKTARASAQTFTMDPGYSWDPSVNDEPTGFDIDDEADDAVIDWANEGHCETLVTDLRGAHYESDFNALCQKYHWSSTEVARAVRDRISEWTGEPFPPLAEPVS